MARNRYILLGGAALLAAVSMACSTAAVAQITMSRPMTEAADQAPANGLPDAPSAVANGSSHVFLMETEPATVSRPTLPAGFGLLLGDFRVSHRPRIRMLPERGYPNSASTLGDAIQAQFKNGGPGYGSLQGFSRRYDAMLADRNASAFFRSYLFPSLLKQELRYSRIGSGSSIWRRAGYALRRTAVTQNDSGNSSVNGVLLLSVLASQTLKNTYYPDQQRGLSPTLGRSANALLDGMQDNLSREFLPDVQQFFWKRASAGLKRLGQQIPLRSRWEPVTFTHDAPAH